MKLAEALQERADVNHRIAQLRQRLEDNALVQEGETTPEDPAVLKQELDNCIQRLSWLICHINLTNCQTAVDGRTLTELIAEKDCLLLKLSVYRDFAGAASQTARRARNTEIKILSTVSVKELQSEIDVLAKQVRLLDNQLQATNWTTDLIETG